MYDIVVVGSGPGGYVAAIRAAQLGKKVAVIEKAEVGGVCLNWGCIPTKALLKSAQVWGYVSGAGHYGVEVPEGARPNMESIVARSRAVADTMSKGVKFLLDKNKIDVMAGFGSVSAPHEVSVTAADGTVQKLKAADIVLATGARPREMAMLPVDGEHIINSRHALALERVPASIIVVGSGAIGSELAYLYAALGAKVTIVEYLPTLMPLEDEEVSKYMERSFRKLRVGVMVGTAVQGARWDALAGVCKVEIEGKKGLETLEAEMVLAAVGIKSNIEGLGLEELGVRVERDKVVVNEYGFTGIEGLWAIGDIVGTPALAHVASAEAVVCVEKICGLDPRPRDLSGVPSCIYTVPEVASVGLTEKQAVEKGFEVRVGKYPFTASGKATSAGDRDGFAKLVFDRATDKLLGAHLVGLTVTEMIAEPTLALALGATARDIAHTIHPHPTMSEAILEAAEAAHDACVHI